MKLVLTNEMIEECKNDPGLSMVAFGQEEDRDISELLGRTIEVSKSEVCIFDDDYGNLYYEIEVDKNKYNIPVQFFNEKCRICGCTWHNACVGGCYWVEEDLCSRCVDKGLVEETEGV